MNRLLRLLLLCASLLAAGTALAGDIDDFVARSFPGPAPAQDALWFTPALKTAARQAAGFAPDAARLRYWRVGARTAWLIDRVGKEQPITFGVVVENDAIVALQVITYRETRGGEIRSPRWLGQFAGAHATDNGLDRRVDSITGATLSARAAMDVARLALFCHRQVVATPAHDAAHTPAPAAGAH